MSAHLVWDWNGTLLDDLRLVVDATNACLATVHAGPVTADEHRRDFRRPISTYYSHVLGRPVSSAEFARMDAAFHAAYRAGLANCGLRPDALAAMDAWSGTQSLLSMWFHDELVALVEEYDLTGRFARVDGLRSATGGGPKADHLVAHLSSLDLAGADAVLIGDSVDDADAAVAVGARCVLFAGGFTDAERLRETGMPVAETLDEAVKLAA
ncbi:MAG TPA: HAD hydrolase-like protein [Micromonosporaceae bacterium]|jgi:phosphoglycolate phosphatase-like HAD superfamily hydrolase|nr:HAD hydrolase-like protein [Micromonosporaceae bacterium]